MKKLFLFIFLFIQHAYSQTTIWTSHLGGGAADDASGACTTTGEYFASGRFRGTNFFTDVDTLNATSHGDLFVTKINSNGNIEWLKQIYCFNPDTTCLSYIGNNLIIDETNQVFYINGVFCDHILVDSIVVYSSGDYDIFLAKFDFNGNCIWAKSAGGVDRDTPVGFAINDDHELYLSGYSSSPISFDTIQSQRGTFIAKYNADGYCIWAKNISPNFTFVGGLMKCFNSKILICGSGGRDSISIDTIKTSHQGYRSVVLACFDLNGNIEWVKEGTFFIESLINSISVDGNGNIYNVGYFKDTLNFDGQMLITYPGQTDMFLIKHDSLGNFIWKKQFLSNDYSLPGDISVNTDGNIYITGILRDTATFGSNIVIPNNIQDMFLAHFDSSGECLGVLNYGYAVGGNVSQDFNMKPYVITHFKNTVNLGLSTYVSHGNYDILISKYDILDGVINPMKQKLYELNIYANPTSGACNISLPDEFNNEKILVLSIIDNTGKLIQQNKINIYDGTIKLSLEAEAKGIYNVSLSNGKRSYSGKIVFE